MRRITPETNNKYQRMHSAKLKHKLNNNKSSEAINNHSTCNYYIYNTSISKNRLRLNDTTSHSNHNQHATKRIVEATKIFSQLTDENPT